MSVHPTNQRHDGGRRLLRRRTYLRKDARRAQILEHAKTAFITRGVQRASIADICAAAGIARGTLYQYFESKRDVLLALLDDVVGRIRRVLAERTPLAELHVDRVRLDARAVQAFCERRMRELLDAIFVDAPTLRLVLRDARGQDQVVEAVIADIDGLLLSAIEAEIVAGQQLGVLGPGDARLLARHNLGGIEKVILMALARDEPLDLDAIVRATVRVQLYGMLDPGVLEVRR